MKPIHWIVVVSALVIILGGAFWYVQTRGSREAGVTITPKPGTQPETATKSSESSNSQKVEVSVDTITIKAVGNYSGSGTATRIFTNGTFTHTVSANIEVPSTGKFYEGWLVNMSLTPKFFSTGKLTKEGGVYKLTYTANKDYSNYNDIVITEESEASGLDGIPESHVLEGTFPK